MKQDDVAGKILLELMELGVVAEENEFTVYTYLQQAYAAGFDRGRHQMRKRKPVAQYGTDGNLINIWESITEAGQALRISRGGISDVVNGKKITCGGYVWRLVNEQDPTSTEEKIGSVKVRSVRQVPKTHYGRKD